MTPRRRVIVELAAQVVWWAAGLTLSLGGAHYFGGPSLAIMVLGCLILSQLRRSR